jgi:predicted transcriptional regulator of viral defense system
MRRERPKIERSPVPSWDRLFETAAYQEGLFTTGQAAHAGYSPQLLDHYLRIRWVVRVRRGIYRLVHFRGGEHADFVVAWLWSGRRGVVSHQTALGLHGLSDLLRWPIHLTVPAAWRSRRLRVPADVALHFADLSPSDRTWRGPVPVTTPRRTLSEGGTAGLSSEELRRVLERALERGLVARSDIAPFERVLRSPTELRRST